MTTTYNITPGSVTVEGNIAGELGTLSSLDIFTSSSDELLTENQRLVNTDLEGISGCSSGGCDEDGNFSLTRDTSVYQSEPGSAKIVNTHTEEQILYLILGEDGPFPVAPDQNYPLTVHVQGLSSTPLLVLFGLDWYDEDGERIMSDYVEGTAAIDTFTQLNSSFQSPENAATAKILIMATAQPGEGFYYDNGSFGLGEEDGTITFGEDITIDGVTFPVVELTQTEA